MVDLALFADRGKGWRKLSVFSSALDPKDTAAMASAIAQLQKSAGMWQTNVGAYYSAKFAVFSSEHGKNDFKLLRRV